MDDWEPFWIISGKANEVRSLWTGGVRSNEGAGHREALGHLWPQALTETAKTPGQATHLLQVPMAEKNTRNSWLFTRSALSFTCLETTALQSCCYPTLLDKARHSRHEHTCNPNNRRTARKKMSSRPAWVPYWDPVWWKLMPQGSDSAFIFNENKQETDRQTCRDGSQVAKQNTGASLNFRLRMNECSCVSCEVFGVMLCQE